MLAEKTERGYRYYVRAWERAGSPDPQTWVRSLASDHVKRNARAGLVWWFRTELNQTLTIASIPVTRTVPSAFSEQELERVLSSAQAVHRRTRPVLELLYSTGARLSEACGIQLEDITTTHVVLRNTKRRAGSGMRVERAIPLSPRSRAAITTLRSMPPGRKNNMMGVYYQTIEHWCQDLSGGLNLRVHPHKFRATFCTHLLQRGVPIHEVQRLMGHGDIATTMRYAAVTDERLALAVGLL